MELMPVSYTHLFLVVRDKACAVIRIPFKSGKAARERSAHIKELIKKAIKEAGVE